MVCDEHFKVKSCIYPVLPLLDLDDRSRHSHGDNRVHKDLRTITHTAAMPQFLHSKLKSKYALSSKLSHVTPIDSNLVIQGHTIKYYYYTGGPKKLDQNMFIFIITRRTQRANELPPSHEGGGNTI